MSRLSNCRHLIFDMDGTLTIAAHEFDAIRDELGIESGLPILETIAKMAPAEAAATRRRLHEIELEIAAGSTPQPAAAELLDTLDARGFSLGILTRNAEDIARVTLAAAGLDGYFLPASVIGRDSCRPKPDPQGVTRHLQQWGASAAQTAIVGDYVFDLQTGRNAGIATVHFACDGHFAWPELTDVAITRIDELLDYLP